MKKNLRWIKLLASGLAFLLLFSSFAACNASEVPLEGEPLADSSDFLDSVSGQETQSTQETDPQSTVGTELESTEETEPESTEETETTPPIYIVCPIAPGLQFNREFKILGWEEGKVNYWGEKEADHPIEISLYKRNATVGERLDVTIMWEFIPGDYDHRESFLKQVETSSQTSPYDAMICHSLMPYHLASKGLAANLANTPYLGFTMSWWPEALIEEVLINDRIYFLAEDNDLGLLRNMSTVFFNNDLLEKKGIESPYDLVRKNEWTIDKLSEMIKDTYEDLNSNKVADEEDLFGFVNADKANSVAWLYALGYKTAQIRNGDLISLLGDETIGRYVEKMQSFYKTDDTFMSDSEAYQMFGASRACFYNGTVSGCESLYGETDCLVCYGVAPMPKLNAEQSRYYTHVNNGYNTWCVPSNVKDMDCTSAVLECMASESYRQVGPVYYDTHVKLRYAPDERLYDMYNLIRESITFDIGLLGASVSTEENTPCSVINACIENPEAYTWQEQYSVHQTAWETAFGKLVSLHAK